MKCFYHNDMDGKCAAAIVRYSRLMGKIKSRFGDEYIEIDYDMEFPFDSINKTEEVFIVDFSLQKDGQFERLLEITDNVIWIDHHKSAIEKHSHLSNRMMGIQDTSKAGCVLTWEHLLTKPLPKIVKLLGDYDIWAFAYGEDTRNLQAGIKLKDTNPEHTDWYAWLSTDHSIKPIIEDGKIIRQYQNMGWSERIRQIGFYAEFEGYRCICCNSPKVGSMLFDSVDPDTYDFMIPFYCSDRGWTVSLYNRKGIDGTEIAKKYGGGGHPGACGFQCKQLFIKDKKIEVIK